jgi:hypothetical protein
MSTKNFSGVQEENTFEIISIEYKMDKKEFGGRWRIQDFLKNLDESDKIGVLFARGGEEITVRPNEKIDIQSGQDLQFVLTGYIDGRFAKTRVYPVTDRKNSAWCKFKDMGILAGLQNIGKTVDNIKVNIKDPVCKRIGSRQEVFSGDARITSGGLKKEDLVEYEGKILSLKQYEKKTRPKVMSIPRQRKPKVKKEPCEDEEQKPEEEKKKPKSSKKKKPSKKPKASKKKKHSKKPKASKKKKPSKKPKASKKKKPSKKPKASKKPKEPKKYKEPKEPKESKEPKMAKKPKADKKMDVESKLHDLIENYRLSLNMEQEIRNRKKLIKYLRKLISKKLDLDNRDLSEDQKEEVLKNGVNLVAERAAKLSEDKQLRRAEATLEVLSELLYTDLVDVEQAPENKSKLNIQEITNEIDKVVVLHENKDPSYEEKQGKLFLNTAVKLFNIYIDYEISRAIRMNLIDQTIRTMYRIFRSEVIDGSNIRDALFIALYDEEVEEIFKQKLIEDRKERQLMIEDLPVLEVEPVVQEPEEVEEVKEVDTKIQEPIESGFSYEDLADGRELDELLREYSMPTEDPSLRNLINDMIIVRLNTIIGTRVGYDNFDIEGYPIGVTPEQRKVINDAKDEIIKRSEQDINNGHMIKTYNESIEHVTDQIRYKFET